MEPKPDLYRNKWDFFIAHARNDKAFALELYTCLQKKDCRPFLDQKSLEPGMRWDQEIPKAQQNSLATIALISGNVREAHYARDEIHTAIHLSRTYPDSHKIIPVYLDDSLEESPDIVYGLRLVQGISFKLLGNDIESLAKRLCPGGKPGAIKDEVAASLVPSHILLNYPTGPLVKPQDIPRSIIDMYSTLIKDSEAKLVVSEANAFRQEANENTHFIIPLNKITSPDRIPAFHFWLEVFDYARLQGPRMLAALLLTVPDDQFDKRAQDDRTRLLEKLTQYSS